MWFSSANDLISMCSVFQPGPAVADLPSEPGQFWFWREAAPRHSWYKAGSCRIYGFRVRTQGSLPLIPAVSLCSASSVVQAVPSHHPSTDGEHWTTEIRMFRAWQAHIWEHHKVHILLLLTMLSALLKLKWHFWKSSICITEPFSWVYHPKTSVTRLSLCQLAIIKISKDHHIFPYWTAKAQGWEAMKKNQGSGDSSISSISTGSCRFWSGFPAGISIFCGSGSFCSANYFCVFLLLLCISLPTSLLTCFGFHDLRAVRLKILL